MIRPNQQSDFDSILSLAEVSGLFESDQTAILEELLRHPDPEDVWFVDEADDGLVGVAYMAPEKMTDGTWNLYWIAIDPRYQRQGRGKAMLANVQTWLTAKEARILLVETSATEDFDYVRKFYAANGFEEEARIRGFYAAGVDKVVYWKQLPSKAEFDGDQSRNEITE